MDTRKNQLYQWLISEFGHFPALESASADASFRRYFRAYLPQGSLIGMDAPPDKENCKPFVQVQAKLEKVGVHVPRIHAFDAGQGFMALEDLGCDNYLDHLTPQQADTLYRQAMHTIVLMQEADISDLPLYDAALLQREMDLFSDWFLHHHLHITLNDAQQRLLSQTWQILIDNALSQPQVFVHRDYHSRNLMWVTERNPGVIDFQDAVVGPITYDLVSLLKDCYILWPREQVLHWLSAFYQLLPRNEFGQQQFIHWFDLMGLQRHLKAIGIFARLHYRDGKSGYMQDIPRTLEYVFEVCQLYPDLREFGQMLNELNVRELHQTHLQGTPA